MITNKGITTGVMSCHNCSTIEGESESSISRNVEQQASHSVPLHWCCDTRPHSGPILYMDGPAFNHLYRGKRPHSDHQDPIQDAVSDSLHHFCTVSDHFLIC